MSADPTLIIQMQRMGDLLLSFPLCARLLRLEPERPVWVVAESAFFSGLMSLAPGVVFFPPDMGPQLRTAHFRRVINLSHREAALDLAGSLATDERIGAFRQNGVVRMEGRWRLYRTSLVGNNRHNRFHWADLEALGLISPQVLAATVWPEPLARTSPRGRIGLFVGASEENKRPDARFWGETARLLLREDLRPVFLGGPQERELAAEAARLGGVPETANFAGRFSLAELAAFMRTLDLVITPDTGPMHLAASVGARTLDLSMGTVNAWETAPAPPGHFVLRPCGSCIPCWGCTRGETVCRRRFTPKAVAGLARSLVLDSDFEGHGGLKLGPELGQRLGPGLRLARTARDFRGLFTLQAVPHAPEGNTPHGENAPDQQREKLAVFWQEWFLSALGGAPHALPAAFQALEAQAPQVLDPLRRGAARLSAGLASGLRRGDLPEAFWLASPPLLRPLSGYLHLLLQNGDFSRQAWSEALELAAAFAEVLHGEGEGKGTALN